MSIKEKILFFKSKKILGFLSFIESIFFPIPTDVLLIPMAISKSYNWASLAFIATYMSVLGGVVGYFLGSFLFLELNPYIAAYGYSDNFDTAKEYFAHYGVIILFISSFTPLPYKVFVITAGFLSINLLLFIIISFIGRGLRFYLVSYVSDRYGAHMIDYINRYFLYIAAFTLIFFVLLI
jgi:membrane protein YqaA with SNARE-associated domain